MILLQQVRFIAAKDLRELLRDRRTLFVNLILPVLLYPLLALIAAQVASLLSPSGAQRPAVAVLNVPEALITALVEEQSLLVLEPSPELKAALSTQAAHQHRETLAALRGAGVVAALVTQDGNTTLFWDDAHRQYPSVRQALQQVAETLRQKTLAERLQAYGLPPSLAQASPWQESKLAPRAEVTRTAAAGIIPLVLLLMLISGTFHPALDLLAGERERGTLETLLAWPLDRRAIFVGKLCVVVLMGLGTVALNLLSLGGTTALIRVFAPHTSEALGGGILSLAHLALAALALIPLALMLAACGLALASMAASYQEAQNYLSPLILLLALPAGLALSLGAQPHYALDCVPVVGPLVVLRSTLEPGPWPWSHLLVSLLASCFSAAVVVHWAVRRLQDEAFLYPHLRIAAWRWRPLPGPAGGGSALILFAAAVGAFLLASLALAQAHPALRVAGPLWLGIALPVVLWLRWHGHRAQHALAWQSPPARAWALLPLWVICALGASLGLALGQLAWVDAGVQSETSAQLSEILRQLRAQGGLPLVLLCVALSPAICEELLFRGALLHALARSLGPASACVISSLLFAALHVSPARFFPQAVLGLLLALVTLRTRSLFPAIAVHALHNGLAVLSDRNRSEAPALGDPLEAMQQAWREAAPSLSHWAPYLPWLALLGAGCAVAIFLLSLRLIRPPAKLAPSAADTGFAL